MAQVRMAQWRKRELHISKVVLDVSRYYSNLLAALFYSMHLMEPAKKT